MQKEFVETGRTDGDKLYTRAEAIERIKELLIEDEELRNHSTRIKNKDLDQVSEDDLIEIGFDFYGFDYAENN
jgi:hypothetical protein